MRDQQPLKSIKKKPALLKTGHDVQESQSSEADLERTSSSDPSHSSDTDRSSPRSLKESKYTLRPPKARLPSKPSKMIKHTQETEEFNPKIHGPLITDDVMDSIKESVEPNGPSQDGDLKLKEVLDVALEASGDRLEVTSSPSNSDVESLDNPNDPDQGSSEPDQESSELDQESSEPDQESSEPDQESSEPDQESSEPDQESSEPDQESSEPDRESSEPDRVDSPSPPQGYLYTEPLYMNDSSLLKAQLDQALEDMVHPEDIIEEISQDTSDLIEETSDLHPLKSRPNSIAEAPTIEPQQRRVAQGFQIEEESRHTGLFETPKRNRSPLHLGLVMLSIIIGGFSVIYFPNEVEVAQTIHLGNEAKEIEYTVKSTPTAYVYEYILSPDKIANEKGTGSWKKLEETPYRWRALRGEERKLKVSLKGYTSQLISYAGFVADPHSPAKLFISIKLTPSKSASSPKELVKKASVKRKTNHLSIKKKATKKRKSTRKHKTRHPHSVDAQRTESSSPPRGQTNPAKETRPSNKEIERSTELQPAPLKIKRSKKKVPELIPLKDDESIDPTRFKEPKKTSTSDPLKVEKIY